MAGCAELPAAQQRTPGLAASSVWLSHQTLSNAGAEGACANKKAEWPRKPRALWRGVC